MRPLAVLIALVLLSPKVEDLLPGTTVSVWFEGPVAESYPVQGRAGRC
jgi:hypothetical protein